MDELLKEIKDLINQREVNQRLLTYQDAADILHIKPQTLRQWVSAKKIDYVKIGSAVRFKRGHIEDFIENSSRRKMKCK